MHDTARQSGIPFERGDDIDPAILEAVKSGGMSLREALEIERVRIAREKGLTQNNNDHWTRPVERPFRRAERDNTTVLFGGLTWKHERLIQANLRRLGYKAEYLPAPDIRAFEKGKEFSNNGLCNPTYFTVGSLLAYLQNLETQGMTREEIIDSYVFFTAGACGPCRFGMYESEHRLALRNAGFEGFRVLILNQQGGLDQSLDDAGLEMNLDFTLGIVNAFIIADVLNDLAYRTRPYEIAEGATDEALEQAMEYMAVAIERMPLFRLSRKGIERSKRTPFRQIEHAGIFLQQLIGRSMLASLREARAFFDAIEVNRSRVKPVVKITGEFWAQTTEGDGNFRMFHFLEQEGAEILIEPITPWLLYLLHQEKQARRDRRLLDVPAGKPGLIRLTGMLRSWLSWRRVQGILTLAERLYAREYRRCRLVLDDIPQALPDQYHFARIAEPYFNTRIEGGEGHLEVAKTIYYSREALCHMILSLKPFGCLPSTQSDGVQSAVVAHHKQVIFLPVETSGEGEANAQSRVQMSLADARERAKHEYEAALRITGLTADDIQRAIASEAELRSPFFALPPDGRHAATSARFVFELARRRKERGE